MDTQDEGIENDEEERIQDGGEEQETAGEEREAADTNINAGGEQVIEGETEKSADVQENHDTQPENEESNSNEIIEETPKEERKHDIKVRYVTECMLH